MEHLSKAEARKLILLSQRIPPAKLKGSVLNATLSAVKHLGYIQIDTISVVHRAHHHTLWNRNPGYQLSHIDQLIRDRQIFEYWSHAAAYLPMNDYRFSLFRKNSIANGDQTHWYLPDRALMDQVLKRIREEGALMAKDFEGPNRKSAWSAKPAKQALHRLFMEGRLMITARNGFHKLYDLRERVLPPEVDTTPPAPGEYARYLITSFLRSNGLGDASEITYLLKNIKSRVIEELNEMHENKELFQIRMADRTYYALADSLSQLSKPLSRSRAKILSPFDNLVIQRKRMKTLFDFDYQVECYVPEAKRKYGYFSLPVLWDGRLLARMDCKADRKKSVLHVNQIHLEPGLRKSEAFKNALTKELVLFKQFNDCEEIQFHKSGTILKTKA